MSQPLPIHLKQFGGNFRAVPQKASEKEKEF
jgi:hypothetical protein